MTGDPLSATFNLLAIDDHRDNLTVLSAVLSEVLEESTLATAQDGERGLELARAIDPDAILLDLIMPGMDGYEVCRRLKADERLRDIPVIVLTALGTDRAARVRALEAGADAFLSKPFDISELVAQVTAMCKLKAASRWRTRELDRLAVMVAERTRALESELAERSRAERELRTSEAKFHALFEQLHDGVTLSRGGVGVDANRRALEMLGLSDRSQFVGRDLTADQSPELAMSLSDFQARLRGGEAEVVTAYNRIRRSDGSSFDLESHTSRVVLDGHAHALSVHRDITDRLRADKEREALQAQLYQSQKLEAVGSLAGGIAHDFNNILSAIILQLNFTCLQPEVSPTELRRTLDELLQSANRASGLTRQLLMFSRRQPIQLARQEVGAILTNEMNMIARLIGDNITLKQDLHPDPHWVDCDVSMIEQVVLNLSVNARDAMPKGGTLTVETRPVTLTDDTPGRPPTASPGSFVCVQVSDTGTGMPPEVLARIFEPFFTTKSAGQGTGLGLATVYGITARHEGWVEAESEPGAGSKFRVYLPTKPPPAAVSGPNRKPTTLARGDERILLVEDEPTVRHMGGRCLKMLGYNVTEAVNAADAIAIWQREGGAFDLLLTDMMMPGELSGLELCLRLRESNSVLKTVITSGYTDTILDRLDDLTPPVGYLAKPYDLNTLASRVRNVLDRQY